MKNIILFDDTQTFDNLKPLTFIRPISEIRIGILTIAQKWESFLNTKISYLTKDYLSEQYPLSIKEENIFINSSVLPSSHLIKKITSLNKNQALEYNDKIIAANVSSLSDFKNNAFSVESISDVILISQLEDIIPLNSISIKEDYKLITKDTISKEISKYCTVFGNDIFIDKSAKIYNVTLNSETGPIYIGKNVEIMEGTCIRGPFAALDNSVIKMNSKIYGATTIGPNTVVAGEVKNSIFFGNSNKGHEGYLGDSIIAEWCNLGAETTCSNLKNNFKNIRLWNYKTQSYRETSINKQGVIMGDGVMTAINTSINTGTVIGICCQIATKKQLPNYIKDFSWINNDEIKEYDINKFFDLLSKFKKSKNCILSIKEKRIFESIIKHKVMRKKIVAGNWKMNNDINESLKLYSEVINIVADEVNNNATVIVAAPYTSLHALNHLKKDANVKKSIHLAAQNCGWEESGAFTGEISPKMLTSLGVEYVILGHSERRQYFSENNILLAKKTDIVLKHNMTPIFCIGETLQEREKNIHFDVIKTQLKDALFHLDKETFKKVVLAYEPVWAIGTGVTATSAQAQEIHAFIRNVITEAYDKETAESITILYGGSCNPKNAQELFSQKDIDGGLIGGASLKSRDFTDIIKSF